MRLLDLAAAEGYDAHTTPSYGPLARAVLANLKAGLSHGHVDDGVARAYLIDVLARIESRLSRDEIGLGRMTADIVYTAMVKVLWEYGDRFFFTRTPPPQDFLEFPALTYQPHLGFKYWLKESVEAMADIHEPEAATIVNLLKAWEEPSNRETDGAIGEDVLWLTPFYGEVRDHVERVNQPRSGPGAPEVANRLREMLGLVRRRPGEHVFAVITKKPLRGLLEGPEAGPFAPTIFDAREYERFRHWPAAGQADSSHVGRTYDLNAQARRIAEDGGHGVPEVVTVPLAFDEVETIIYLGAITAAEDAEFGADGTWRALTREDHAFADEVSSGEDPSALAAWLAERLDL